MNARLSKLINGLCKVEAFALIIIFAFTLGLALLQIILRNVFDTSISWADDATKIMVLWIGMLGAMMASCKMEHIRIDILSHYLPEKWHSASQYLVYSFSALVCFIVAYYAYQMVLLDKADGIMGFASVPLWICESIIPFAFFVMGLRFFLFNFGIQIKETTD